MQIDIKGNPRNITHYEVKYALNFFANTLIAQEYNKAELLNELFVDVEFVYNIDGHGYVGFMDSNHKPREFLMSIKANLTYNKTLMALAHEMVHVKQYVLDELFEYVTTRGTRFKSKNLDPFIKSFHVIDETDSDIEYFDMPWEIEAYGREIGLIDKYKRHLENESGR